MNTVAKGLALTGLVVAVVGIGGYAYKQYRIQQVGKFCREIGLSDTTESVITRARSQELLVRDLGNVIVVGGYRHTCRIETNGQLIVRTGIA